MTHHFSKEDFNVERDDLDSMSLGELKYFAWLHFTGHRDCRNKLNENSTNSSCPPSTDNPFRPAAKELESSVTTEDSEPKDDADSAAASCDANPHQAEAVKTNNREEQGKRNPGKQPGAKGHGRGKMNRTAEEVHHAPTCCASCGAPFGSTMQRRCVSAHFSLEYSSDEMSQKITLYKHVYHAVLCPCGRDNVSRPGVGMSSQVEGRRRNLEMSERCLIGPALAAYIANLSMKYRLSRRKIAELLHESFGLTLSTATIERCIHELGLASEPVVRQVTLEMRGDNIVHVDETPWYQKGKFLWLWVMTNEFSTVFHIGSRRKEELVELIGESFMGWMITDGYMAYRDHLRRQRCLAHLIRKALALAEGFYGKGSVFGRRLVNELRGLIQRVHDGVGADTPAMKRFMARLKFNCECNRYDDEKKVRQLAGEILNDWDAIIAFVHNPELPPTNNDAERALRHAIIARKISFGTRTDEGSRFYAAALSVITTCRQRGVRTLGYITSLISAARTGLAVPPMPDIPTRAVA